MWSTKQLRPSSANAFSEVLALFNLLGVEFNPISLDVDSEVDFDINILRNIPDKYAGLIIVFDYLANTNILPYVTWLNIIKEFKDEISEFTQKLFAALRMKSPIDTLTLILAISDRQIATLMQDISIKNISFLDWKSVDRMPTTIEGISYRLNLILEDFWHKHEYSIGRRE